MIVQLQSLRMFVTCSTRNYDMMITLMSARVPSTVGPQYFDIMEKQLGKAGLRRFY